MKQIEWACPKCSYRTSLPVTFCPVCVARLVLQERTWAPSPKVWGNVNGLVRPRVCQQ